MKPKPANSYPTISANFVPAAGEASAFPNRDADVDDGIKASGVPTQVIGLLTVLENHGNLDRQTVMAPAIRFATDGFPVTP
ncbi:MAG TPA: gamma-glutamyltransferase, partial [Bacilli bacterium]|nr:gamma-glutamyltransferase [Bacilli bacterium]